MWLAARVAAYGSPDRHASLRAPATSRTRRQDAARRSSRDRSGSCATAMSRPDEGEVGSSLLGELRLRRCAWRSRRRIDHGSGSIVVSAAGVWCVPDYVIGRGDRPREGRLRGVPPSVPALDPPVEPEQRPYLREVLWQLDAECVRDPCAFPIPGFTDAVSVMRMGFVGSTWSRLAFVAAPDRGPSERQQGRRPQSSARTTGRRAWW
jgi:hypothetical protein